MFGRLEWGEFHNIPKVYLSVSQLAALSKVSIALTTDLDRPSTFNSES